MKQRETALQLSVSKQNTLVTPKTKRNERTCSHRPKSSHNSQLHCCHQDNSNLTLESKRGARIESFQLRGATSPQVLHSADNGLPCHRQLLRWKMIWTAEPKAGPWSNKPCMGPTSLCIKFLEPKRGVRPGPRNWDPGRVIRVGPGGTRMGSLRLLFSLRNVESAVLAGFCTSPVPCFPGNARAGDCEPPFLFTLHPVWVIQC